MRAILLTDINDWTNDFGNMPKIPKGTEIVVKRMLDRARGFTTEYLGTVNVKHRIYHFEIMRDEFEAIV